MAALQARRARLLASLYATFGEAATWTPAAGGAAVPVTIRRNPEDVVQGFGQSEALVSKDFVRVRKSEVAAPAKGDLVTITASGEQLRVVADPRLRKAGLEWACEPGQVRGY